MVTVGMIVGIECSTGQMIVRMVNSNPAYNLAQYTRW